MKNGKVIVAITALFCIINVSASMSCPCPCPSGASLSRGGTQWTDLTIDGILKGSLGSDRYGASYASKVNEIRYYNYSSKGLANIWTALMREVDKINVDVSLDQAAKIARLKSLVDNFYNTLITYKLK